MYSTAWKKVFIYLFSFTHFFQEDIYIYDKGKTCSSPTKTFRIFNNIKILNIKIIKKPEGFSGTWAGLTILCKYLKQQYMQLFHSLNTSAYTKTFFQAVLYNAEFLAEANTLCGQNAALFFFGREMRQFTMNEELWTKNHLQMAYYVKDIEATRKAEHTKHCAYATNPTITSGKQLSKRIGAHRVAAHS